MNEYDRGYIDRTAEADKYIGGMRASFQGEIDELDRQMSEVQEENEQLKSRLAIAVKGLEGIRSLFEGDMLKQHVAVTLADIEAVK